MTTEPIMEPVVAQAEPYEVVVTAGRTYWWCSCGLSKKQPFCDGTHKGTGLSPLAWKAEEDGTAWFCGCKKTGGHPMCDGSHNGL
ncbi:hypothetical protein GCM10011505_26860 [Tistrella bauzanensis]|uniref:Iron-binding zinc finger CDGSH type domain-containing protein n=1 Tax=Tistrella bauzanensis TaxID=657419 RepID=A0ABQ1ILJ6_9PROT|nr:CDGSH iron-sulfur domain-containing protein [Tistrella bauzanensis]GGB44158.1 hypothetical protein GCM10011505_26860 [Tistrella bauzanensis]